MIKHYRRFRFTNMGMPYLPKSIHSLIEIGPTLHIWEEITSSTLILDIFGFLETF